MRQKSGPAERVVKEIRRAIRRQFSADEKIRIVLDGLRGEDSNRATSSLNGERNHLGTPSEIKSEWRTTSSRNRGRLPSESAACSNRGWGGQGMRYPASEKLEIIRVHPQ